MKSVMMTNWRRQRRRPRGLVTREVVEIVWSQCLPMETVYEVTHGFEKRFRGKCRAQEAWKIIPRDLVLECFIQVVHHGSGGPAAQGKGTD